MHYLVPLDFSDNSLKALDYALALASPKVDRITLIHVVETKYDFASQVEFFTKQQLKEGKKRGKELLSLHGDSKISLKFRLAEGNPALQISQTASKQKVDLIVMGTKGATGIPKTLIGTVAVSVVREAPCAVLVVPATAPKFNPYQFVLGLEFAEHEPAMLDWLAKQLKKWKSSLQVVHVRPAEKQGFKQVLLELGIKQYFSKKYPSIQAEFLTLTGAKPREALGAYMKSQPGILVMSHAHQGFWEELFTKSDSIQMAYQTKGPLLVLR
ncbi:MAG: universal stress protein [Algoriphagus sp.]|nr:universal stress protein [Algoriphagus sp.]